MPGLETERPRPLFPAADSRLRGAHAVHDGPLFEVIRATVDGRDLALKRRTPGARWQAPVASRWHLYNKTNTFFGNQFGWTEHEPAPDDTYFDRLLVAEHAVLARAAPDWNHPGAALARWHGDHLAPPADDAPGALCLVTPWCAGQLLSSLPRFAQRRLFPSMLPALWDALAACPHGDLSATSLMIEDGWFRVLDPGVRIEGPHASHSPYLSLDSWLLTTNAAHYPLVLPDHGPDPARLHALPGALERSIDLSAGLDFARLLQYPDHLQNRIPPPPVPTPSAADVIACGAIYFALLSGRSLASALDLDEPLWTGLGGECSLDTLERQQERIDRCLASLARGIVPSTLRASDASDAEIALCERLILVDLEAGDLPGCIAALG